MSERVVVYEGEEMALVDAIRRSGSPHNASTVATRLKLGWPLAAALHRPVSVARGQRMPMRPLHFAGGRR